MLVIFPCVFIIYMEILAVAPTKLLLTEIVLLNEEIKTKRGKRYEIKLRTKKKIKGVHLCLIIYFMQKKIHIKACGKMIYQF